MDVGSKCYAYIKSLGIKDYVLKVSENQYSLKSDISAIIYVPDSDIVEISCKTCKFNPNEPCMCDSKYEDWVYGGDKMTNEMPELKPGMVLELNDNSIAVLCGEESYKNFNSNEIKKIYKPKPVIAFRFYNIGDKFDFSSVISAVNSSWNLIWQRKPAVDWSKVAVDTKVLVKFNDTWEKRYFAKYENGKIFVWSYGKTSFTKSNNNGISDWKNGNIVLYEGNEHLVP